MSYISYWVDKASNVKLYALYALYALCIAGPFKYLYMGCFAKNKLNPLPYAYAQFDDNSIVRCTTHCKTESKGLTHFRFDRSTKVSITIDIRDKKFHFLMSF